MCGSWCFFFGARGHPEGGGGGGQVRSAASWVPASKPLPPPHSLYPPPPLAPTDLHFEDEFLKGVNRGGFSASSFFGRRERDPLPLRVLKKGPDGDGDEDRWLGEFVSRWVRAGRSSGGRLMALRSKRIPADGFLPEHDRRGLSFLVTDGTLPSSALVRLSL